MAWLALQYLRTPAIRNGHTQIAGNMYRMIVGVAGKKALRSRIERAVGPISDARLDAEWADLTKRGGPTLRPDVNMHIRSILNLTPGTAALFADSQWSLNVFQRKRLLTCDHPVVLVPEPDHPEFLGVGLANAGGYVIALARNLGLVIMGPKYEFPDMRVPGVTAMARSLNMHSILNVRRAAFHHPDDRHLLDGVQLLSRTQEIDVSSGDNFVQEDGFFGDLNADQLKAFRSASSGPGRQGVGVEDIPWPIPDRVFEWSEL